MTTISSENLHTNNVSTTDKTNKIYLIPSLAEVYVAFFPS